MGDAAEAQLLNAHSPVSAKTGASAPVFAQSQVSVYGVADQAIDSGNYGVGNVTRLTGSGYTTERLGFKGSEDLVQTARRILRTGDRTLISIAICLRVAKCNYGEAFVFNGLVFLHCKLQAPSISWP